MAPKRFTKPVVLYARVSTGEQSVDAQIHELRKWARDQGVKKIEKTDQTSGRNPKRPGLDEILNLARRRKISAVVVVRLDRLARSLGHMASVGEELHELGVELVSLTEGIDTSTPTGRALFGMCGVFAQLEVDLICERTKAGVAHARRTGKRLGRPPVLDGRNLKRVRRLRKAGKTHREIAEVLGVGQSTIRRALERAEKADVLG